jgi:hypothetical protein
MHHSSNQEGTTTLTKIFDPAVLTTALMLASLAATIFRAQKISLRYAFIDRDLTMAQKGLSCPKITQNPMTQLRQSIRHLRK